MKQRYIKAFTIMLVLMTVLLILSYMLIGIVFQFLTLLVMVAGFVICLRKVSSDGFTLKKLLLSLLTAVGAMAAAQFISRLAVVGVFALASSGGHHI